MATNPERLSEELWAGWEDLSLPEITLAMDTVGPLVLGLCTK